MFKALLELGPKAAWQRLEFKNSLGASVWGIPEVEPSEHEPGYMVTIKYNGTIIAFYHVDQVEYRQDEDGADKEASRGNEALGRVSSVRLCL